MAKLEPVHPYESDAAMPYVPGIKVEGGSTLLFLSGSSALPLYHDHPHVPEQEVVPYSIEDQTRRVMENIQSVLDAEGLTFRDVVRSNIYITDVRDIPGASAVMREYFGDWRPTSTLLCVNMLSSPGARIELEMTAVK